MSSCFSWVQAGLKKVWECLKAWPDPTMGFGSSILSVTGHSASSQGSAWCWISAPGPRWGSCSQNSSVQPSQQLWNWFLSRIWGTSQGQRSCRGHMGLGTPGCHTQCGVTGLGWVGWRERENCEEFWLEPSLNLYRSEFGIGGTGRVSPLEVSCPSGSC